MTLLPSGRTLASVQRWPSTMANAYAHPGMLPSARSDSVSICAVVPCLTSVRSSV